LPAAQESCDPDVQYLPIGQAMHEVAVVKGAWVPAGQLVHAMEPLVFENFPLGQTVQVGEPALLLK